MQSLIDFKTLFGCVILFVVLIKTTSSSVEHSCRDENNKPVDWYVIYKPPRIETDKNPLVQAGKAYAYITSDDNQGWILSEKPITDPKSIPGLTLAPIYEKKTKGSSPLLYMLYNDQPPPQQNKFFFHGGGHAKGAVVAGNTGGFWLVHSAPRYAAKPDAKTEQHTYPYSSLKFGQSFLCITLKPKDLELAGSQLFYNEIHIHAKNVPSQLKKMYPNLVTVISNKHVKKAPWNKALDIASASGKEFRVFAKASDFHQELYSNWVAPDLGVDLVVQTWPNVPSHQGSTCDKQYRVENVDTISVAGVSFPTNIDHSKWAASQSQSKPWVCVGDINKDVGQTKRGGGTVCIQDKSLWEAYHKSITSVESCKQS